MSENPVHQFDRRNFMKRAAQGGLGLAFSGSLATVIAACGSSKPTTQGAENALPRGRKSGNINLAFINQPPPDSYIDPKTGLLTGADPVILSAILKKIGIPHTTDILTDFNSVIPG